MRLRPLSKATVLAAALGLAACDYDVQAIGPQDREVVTETRPLDAQGTFRLENTNGGVNVETWAENRVHIEAEKVGTREGIRRIEIEIRGEGDRVEVITRQPRGGWSFGRHAYVTYRVKVPARAQLELGTTNGALHVRAPGGPLRASTTNGAVEIADAAGVVEAQTTNGPIRADFRQAPAEGWNRFTTTNGGVTLTLPPDATGEFEARTTNGRISSDFPLEVSGRGHRLRGRLGEGRARFELRTTNGGVRIRKRAV